MIISINPTYLCNFRCDFCYLTKEQLADKERTHLEDLDLRLKEVADYKSITGIDLYGGEISCLDEDYLERLYKTIRKYYDGRIKVTTNLSKIIPFFLKDDIDLSVSYDFSCRERHELVFFNMLKIDKDLEVFVLATKDVMNLNVDEMISTIHLLSNVKEVEIKPYSTNQANQDDIKYSEFEDFVKEWIRRDKNFLLINEDKINKCLSKKYSSYSNDHIYITPTGKFAVLSFDENDHEYFEELDNLNDFGRWCIEELRRTKNNIYCFSCNHIGHCLSEHLRDVKSLDNSCNGFKNLLDWYETRS